MVISDESNNLQVFPVNPLRDDQIVDTNGAGDAFAGGFMGALAAGKNLGDSILAGHALACASDHLSFEPGIRNDIVIQFTVEEHGHLLHDIELLDESGLDWRTRIREFETSIEPDRLSTIHRFFYGSCMILWLHEMPE